MAKKMQQSELDHEDYTPVPDSMVRQMEERFPTGCLMLRQDSPPEEWPTSLEVGSSKWRAALVNADCTPDLEIGNDWSEPFTVTDWLVKWREGVDEKTGEVRQYPWLVLFCSNGDVIGTSSQVVPHQLARALRMYGPEDWQRGVTFKIRRRLSRSGQRSYHELRVCE